MTLLEKIKNYKWFDSPNKLKPILEELYNSIGGGSGGGTQDLQSVLDNGGVYISDDDTGERRIIAFRNTDNQKSPLFYIDSNNPTGQVGGSIAISENFVSLSGFGNGFSNQYAGNYQVLLGRINIIQNFDSIAPSATTLSFTENLDEITNLFLPAKPSGDYTLATLNDILKINLDSRVYANNAAAITGGLTAKDLYRTATGELRIVI